MSCWLVSASWKPAIPNGFASRRYNLTDDGNMRAPCVPNAINTLSEETHLSTTNSSNLCSSNIKVNLSKKKKKFKVKVTVDKKTKRQKDVFFKHCWSSHTLQRYKTQYNNTPLFWFFFFHSLLWFLGFSQMIVWWVSFHFDFLSLFNIFCFDNFNSQHVPFFCCHLKKKKKQYMGSFYLLNIVYVVSSFMLYVISGRQYN